MSYVGNVSFSRSVDDDIDPDYVYYNATIINNRTGLPYDRSADPQVRFQETRDVPILNDASKYNFSIIRFTMNGPNKDLPMFMPVIRTGSENPTNNIDLTIYSATIDLAVNNTTGANPVVVSLSSTQPVIWQTETLDTLQAPPPLASTCQTGQDVATRYYWCYTYSHWLLCVNAALQSCITDLQTQFDAAWVAAGNFAPAPSLGIVAPYLTYNPTSNLFTLSADVKAFGGANRSSIGTASDYNATLYFNSNLFGMFSNFQNKYVNVSGTEKTNEIYTGAVGYYGGLVAGVPTGQNVLAVGGAGGTKYFWQQVQDFESTSTLWSPIENIVFNSTLLPLVFEQTGDPVKFGNSNTNTALTNSQSAFQPIITDIALPVQDAHSYRELIYYAPQAEYRLASFQRSKQPISQIDIQVFWRNRLDGNLYPVQMFNCSSVSVKVMFRRRGIFDYPHPAKGGVDV